MRKDVNLFVIKNASLNVTVALDDRFVLEETEGMLSLTVRLWLDFGIILLKLIIPFDP